MGTNKDQFWNKAMFWGFIIALASMIATTIYYSTDNMFSKSASWVGWGIFIAGLIVATISYKNTLSENAEFPYSRSLGFGVATSMFAGLILAVFTFVLYKFIDPDIINQILAFTEETLIESGAPDDMIEKQMELQEKIQTPALNTIYALLGTVIKGLIISLLTSIFLKKKTANGFEAAMNDLDD